MPATPITIELSSPQTVDGRLATYQSLWLLVRLLHAHAAGQPVRIDDLRGHQLLPEAGVLQVHGVGCRARCRACAGQRCR